MTGKAGKAVYDRRFELFFKGQWTTLLEESRTSCGGSGPSRKAKTEEEELQRTLLEACKLVRLGELSRARQALLAAKLAPGDKETLAKLTNPERRPPRPLDLPEEVRSFQPAEHVKLDKRLFLENVRRAPRGSSASLSGWRNEHWKVLLDSESATDYLYLVAAQFARADLPTVVADTLTSGKMVALQKEDGGVRGLVAGETLRRLVARTLAQQYGKELEAACFPFQFALSTRAGTECVSHLVRALTDLGKEATVVSVDGIGAYDLMRRKAMLGKLHSKPKLNALLPFVMMSYGQPSKYVWTDDEGNQQVIRQGEGGEQGDPLMPALFCLGQHDALQAVRDQLQPDELLFAYLNDIYVICKPERARDVFDLVESTLKAHTGISCNMGKTRVWNRAGVEPPRVRELGEDVWVGGADREADKRGVKVLGTPVGTQEYANATGDKLLAKERALWDLLPQLPDLQSAWLLLLQCAGPRFNYRARAVPPTENTAYATGHDKGMWTTLCALLERLDLVEGGAAKQKMLATLPMRSGGLGLRSAVRTGPAAYWASWADTLPMIAARCPAAASQLEEELKKGVASESASVVAASAALAKLQVEGYEAPDWRDVLKGQRPPPVERPEPGDFRHGWQYYAASRTETYTRDGEFFASCSKATRALVRSQAGRCSGCHLTVLPLTEELRWTNAQLKVLLLRRLRLPLSLDHNRCKCGRKLDKYGDHRAACSTVGVLKVRAIPQERAWARVCREAGGRVTTNRRLADLNLGAQRPRKEDDRRLEVVVQGLPVHHGSQVAVDATLVSPLKRSGEPQPKADWLDGAALQNAVKAKENRYPELLAARRCKLLVAGQEVGGRWSEEAYLFLVDLARAKAESATRVLRGATATAYLRRWTALLSKAAMESLADTLLYGTATHTELWNRPDPPLGAVLGEDRCGEGCAHSRMPL